MSAVRLGKTMWKSCEKTPPAAVIRKMVDSLRTVNPGAPRGFCGASGGNRVAILEGWNSPAPFPLPGERKAGIGEENTPVFRRGFLEGSGTPARRLVSQNGDQAHLLPRQLAGAALSPILGRPQPGLTEEAHGRRQAARSGTGVDTPPESRPPLAALALALTRW